MSRICLYYRPEPAADRWVPGDRFVRPVIRRLIRGRPRASGLDRVFLNLCAGLDRVGTPYQVNLPFRALRPDDLVGVLGLGRHALDGYDRPNPIVAGIGLMSHPSEWPDLCDQYPVVRYLQHSEWAADVYRPYFGARCHVWPVGIDTDHWSPWPGVAKDIDFLLYDKIHWDRNRWTGELIEPLRALLEHRGLSFVEVRYGQYAPAEYRGLLARSRAMVFLSAHESQGLAYQEALAAGVPVLAWDPGRVLDPNRFQWGDPVIPATSVPYFDDRCGSRFRTAAELPARLSEFLDRLSTHQLAPREYILENLTLERCSTRFIDILHSTRVPGPRTAPGPIAANLE